MRRKPPITVVTTVCWSIWEPDEVLLGQRKGGDAAGVWCSPGGKADDPDESLREAAARELRQETGVMLAPGDLVQLPVWSEYVAEDGQRFTCVYFEAKTRIGRSDVRCAEPDKFEGWSFWRPGKLPALMFNGDRAAVYAAAAKRLL